MKPEVREYQAQAAQCLEAAQRALTPEVRQAYLDLMKQLIGRAEETRHNLTTSIHCLWS